MQLNAIVLGASSGIGLEVSKLLASKGYRIAVAARRFSELEKFSAGVPEQVSAHFFDISADDAVDVFMGIASKIGRVDVIYLCCGLAIPNPELDWALEQQMIDTNVVGFASIAGAALTLFENQGYGQLTAIISVAALRGEANSPAYCATKAFQLRYLQSLRLRVKKCGLPIVITDIRPGYVATPMMEVDKPEAPFWVVRAPKAARQIVQAAETKRKRAYVSRRWALIGWLLRHLPE